MISVLQRVSSARVVVDGQTVGEIGPGLLVLLCAERGDTEVQAQKLLTKILKLRIFGDAASKMNRSVQDLDGQGRHGGLLIVSQFTQAAPPDEGRRLYDAFVDMARQAHSIVQTGQFAADMQVHLVNDGPVTIPLRMTPSAEPDPAARCAGLLQ
jgi:D-tyrosyl-tRNA(Tyr) deacylase